MSAAEEIARSRDARWWTSENEPNRAKCIMTVAGALWRDQVDARTEMLRCARTYGNVPLLGLSPRLYRRRSISNRRSKLALNVIKAVCDTYTAMVTEDQPKVSYQTMGGDWGLQQRAKALERFTDGVFFDAGLHELDAQLVLDTALFGVAWVKPIIEWNGWDEEAAEDDEPKGEETDEEKADAETREQPRVVFERVQSWRILIDEQEAYNGYPKSLYEITYVDRLNLMQEYPDKANELIGASSSEFEEWGADSGRLGESFSDDVCVVEAWHLPLNARSGDGRHTIVCGHVVLFDEPYVKKSFPHEALYRLRPAFGGIWGDSLASELEGIQYEINVLLQKIQRSHHLLAAGHWLVEQGSNIVTGQIDNQVGSIVKYRGTPPQMVTGNTIAPEVYQQLDRLYNRAFEIVGISQQAAQSQKPAGLNSGKAMLVYADIISKRFQPSYRLFQHFHVRLARKVIDLARDIADRFPTYSVKVSGSDMAEVVKWADANLEDEKFVLRPFATNALADEPAARLEMVQNLANSGLIMEKEDVLRLLDMPDLRTYQNMVDSPYQWVMSVIDDIRHGKDYKQPEPYFSKEQMTDAVVRMQRAYYQSSREKLPEDRLSNMRTWMQQATEMIMQPIGAPGGLRIPSPAPPPGMPAGPTPPGMAPMTGV